MCVCVCVVSYRNAVATPGVAPEDGRNQKPAVSVVSLTAIHALTFCVRPVLTCGPNGGGRTSVARLCAWFKLKKPLRSSFSRWARACREEAGKATSCGCSAGCHLHILPVDPSAPAPVAPRTHKMAGQKDRRLSLPGAENVPLAVLSCQSSRFSLSEAFDVGAAQDAGSVAWDLQARRAAT